MFELSILEQFAIALGSWLFEAAGFPTPGRSEGLATA
jgi:hypothetical protein